MGLQGKAALVGVADYKNVRKYTGKRKFYLEQWAELTQMALADAGLSKDDIDGICCSSIPESDLFAPATVAEYLGLKVNFAEMVDLGGASSVRVRGDRNTRCSTDNRLTNAQFNGRCCTPNHTDRGGAAEIDHFCKIHF